jgi:2-C-methyl-D-erythritol 4-phosphate cytidylyltransferase
VIHGLGLIVVAAGSSARMQGTDKIWALLDRHSVVWHSVNALSALAEQTVVVVREEQRARAQVELASLEQAPRIVPGGPRRQDSVARGLSELHGASIVAVHDAARPLVEADLLVQGAELVKKCDGAVPALPVTDTIKEIDDHDGVVRTIDRSGLRSIQTPQVFRLSALLEAHASRHASSTLATDDAALLEACHFDVRVFPGRDGNFKITTSYDLKLAQLVVANWGAS